jgi:DNA-binding NarL/FixJ family response regulator
MPIKVLLADDSEMMRQAIRRLLERETEIDLVGEVSGFAETIQLAKELKPHVIVMDLRVVKKYDVNPVEAKTQLTREDSRLLAISVWNNDEAEAVAESLGAVALLDKMNLHHELVPAIMRVASSGALDG